VHTFFKRTYTPAPLHDKYRESDITSPLRHDGRVIRIRPRGGRAAAAAVAVAAGLFEREKGDDERIRNDSRTANTSDSGILRFY